MSVSSRSRGGTDAADGRLSRQPGGCYEAVRTVWYAPDLRAQRRPITKITAAMSATSRPYSTAAARPDRVGLRARSGRASPHAEPPGPTLHANVDRKRSDSGETGSDESPCAPAPSACADSHARRAVSDYRPDTTVWNPGRSTGPMSATVAAMTAARRATRSAYSTAVAPMSFRAGELDVRMEHLRVMDRH